MKASRFWVLVTGLFFIGTLWAGGYLIGKAAPDGLIKPLEIQQADSFASSRTSSDKSPSLRND